MASQCVVVTGAAGALGSAVSRHLSKNGYAVALVDVPRAEDALRAMAAELGRACAVAIDSADESAWDEAMPRIEKELGLSPSHAALIAGGWQGGSALHAETDDKVWRAMLTQNLETVHAALRALLPGMVSRT